MCNALFAKVKHQGQVTMRARKELGERAIDNYKLRKRANCQEWSFWDSRLTPCRNTIFQGIEEEEGQLLGMV